MFEVTVLEWVIEMKAPIVRPVVAIPMVIVYVLPSIDLSIFVPFPLNLCVDLPLNWRGRNPPLIRTRRVHMVPFAFMFMLRLPTRRFFRVIRPRIDPCCQKHCQHPIETFSHSASSKA